MVLSIVGLGLGDVEDVTLKGFNAVKEADVVFLEIYTSLVINANKQTLESFYGKEILEADRICIEEQNDKILEEAKTKKVAILVGGDPFSATTHSELYLKAIEQGIDVKVIHNASIMNAVASCGLQLYRFGETVSIPFFEVNWRPRSFYDKIIKNRSANLHTLCLLDIKVRERSVENLMANRLIFEPPRFMTVNVAIDQILEIDNELNLLGETEIKAIGISRLGTKEGKIISGTLQSLRNSDFGVPLHSLIICAPELHDLELSFYNHYASG
ncbi:diphthine synthase, putative [Theileria equi strain WA]|uniref:diphthine methyl ester synthase n=1 Tax=Theileria equi strain WA TaxID=1537102 RepID=L1L9F1_THEEQ|nr:diphthine synthase, putative [Theileria equi strain WA]EKX72121.1 diphthine synthase, putative [Theileria equi strain WA]|eukprot:XP_004831573.1 diphthine synthase, putative [Theileria equi strain WA]